MEDVASEEEHPTPSRITRTQDPRSAITQRIARATPSREEFERLGTEVRELRELFETVLALFEQVATSNDERERQTRTALTRMELAVGNLRRSLPAANVRVALVEQAVDGLRELVLEVDGDMSTIRTFMGRHTRGPSGLDDNGHDVDG